MQKTIAVVSELLLYLIPVILLLREFYYIYKAKKVMQQQYYGMLYALPFVILVLSFKGVLILENLSDNVFLYVIDFGLLVFLTVFTVALFRTVLKSAGINRLRLNVFDFALLLGTLVAPVINHRFYNWFDFFIYCSIGTIVVFVSIFFAKADRRLRKYMYFNVFLLYINVVLFILLGSRFANTYPGIIYLSISGLIIFIATVREAHIFFMAHIKELELPQEVHYWHLKTMFRALTVSIVISALSLTAVVVGTMYVLTVHNKLKSDINQDIFQRNNAVMENTKNLQVNIGSAVKLLALNINSLDDTKNVREELSAVFDRYSNDFYYFDVINNKGTVITAYPLEPSVDNFVLDKGYEERILLAHIPTISSPVKTSYGFETIFICYPIFNGGRFAGFVEGAVNINAFNKVFVSAGENGPASYIKTILMESNIVVGGNGGAISPGSTTSLYNDILRDGNLFSEEVSFKYLNGKFKVLSYVPKAVVVRYTNNVIKTTGFAFFLILFALFYVMYLVISMLRNVDLHLGKAVEHAISREENARKSAVDVSERLMKLTGFFDTVSFDQSNEIFYKNLLDLSIKMIPSADKGSIALKNGDYLEFVASFGYPLENIKKCKLRFDTQRNLMKEKMLVVNKIRELDKELLSEEELRVLKEANNEDVKSTLIASVYTEGKYIGSIYIDNMEREDAFTEEDNKIAEAISNVASMFVEARRYMDKMKQALRADSMIVGLMGDIEELKGFKSIMSYVLLSLQRNVSCDIIGACAIVYSVTGLLKLCAAEEIDSETPMDEFKVNAVAPMFVNASDIEDIPWTSKMNGIYLVPDKKSSGGGMYIGFSKSKAEISRETLGFLDMLLPQLYDVISNLELTKELSRVYIELLISMIHSIELKDPYTRNHSERVTVFAYMLGKHYGLSLRQSRMLYYAAMLHDIGKIGIPDKILKKKGHLTKEEFDVIKQHPQIGANMIMGVSFLKESSYIILFHHEHYDGSGYPAHLKGDQIPLLSRIIAIVDVFDAIITERPYKDSHTINEAIKYIREAEGTHFDPELAEMFIDILTNERAKIISVIENPDVMIIYEELFGL